MDSLTVKATTTKAVQETKIPGGFVGGYDRYLLYPYFGGDEVASHPIDIRIKDISGKNSINNPIP